MTTTRHITQSECYPKYNLVEHNGSLHVCLRADDEPDFGCWFSCGVITHEENFETVCDDLEESFRDMLSCLG